MSEKSWDHRVKSNGIGVKKVEKHYPGVLWIVAIWLLSWFYQVVSRVFWVVTKCSLARTHHQVSNSGAGCINSYFSYKLAIYFESVT